ncbi:ABC transporter ATP-binding protein [bacterium]|nr:ABC transporter ATP-binding protein [bacterium]
MTEPIVELRGIRKTYPGTVALDGVDLELRPGEVRALLGENGAGKSTLTGILYGLVRPDSGEVRVRGRPVEVRSPASALALGIGLVHQHFALAPSLTVAESVELGLARSLLPRAFDAKKAAETTAELSRRTGLAVDPWARVGDLPLGVRQRVEILKALRRDVRVLLLDEPTAVLAPGEVDELFSVLARLRDEGRAILLITHKLREVARLADRVTVLRRGRVVATDLPARETHEDALAALMMGEAHAPEAESIEHAKKKERGETAGAAVLSLRDVTAFGPDGREALSGVSLEVRQGEIVGIAGVAGNGQDELYRLATGLLAQTRGHVELRGAPAAASPRDFVLAGVAAIPGERHALALAPSLSCEENLALKDVAVSRSPARALGVIDRSALRKSALERMDRHDVRPRDPARLAGELSGGNQQKLVLARELSGSPPLVVALDPSRGLDVAAQALVARELERAREAGAAVLLVSTDLDEVVSLADRAFALHAGKLLAGSIPPDREELGRLMLGGAR